MILPISLSDHYIVFCVRKFDGGLPRDLRKINTRRMKKFNEQMFLMDFTSIIGQRLLVKLMKSMY